MSTNSEKLAALLSKTVGENDGTDDNVLSWVDTGFAPLNKAMSGGYKRGYGHGKIYEIFGESSAGKTLLATIAMAKAQQMGGIAIFLDFERSFSGEFAQEFGLDTERPHFMYSRPRSWESAHQYIVESAGTIRDSGLIPPEAPIIVVVDSIASASPESQINKGASYKDLNMADTTALARIASVTLRSIKSFAADDGFTMIYLNQMRDIPAVMYGPKFTTPGGKAMSYYADARLQLTKKLDKNKDGEGLDSQMVKALVVKSKHTRPFQSVEWKLRYDDRGLASMDVIESTVEYMRGRGIIGSGGWTEWDGQKIQGSAKLYDYILEHNQEDRLIELLYNSELETESEIIPDGANSET